MTDWPLRRWVVATATALATVAVVGVPTVLIPNPWFGREVAVTWWAWPVLLVTAVLSGLVTATYVRSPSTPAPQQTRSGMAGGFLTYLAVGCPVCNKIALLALGYAGAIRWFAPVQPTAGSRRHRPAGLRPQPQARRREVVPRDCPASIGGGHTEVTLNLRG